MDSLANFGLAGAVLAATGGAAASVFVWMRGLLQSQVAAREADLAWCRRELDLKRGEYLAALKDQACQYTASLARIEATFTEAISELCSRLERIENKLK